MLRCYDVTPLRSGYAVTMLRPRVDFLHVVNETRPLRHGITAAFGVPLYTERNEAAFGVLLDTERNRAVKSWNNGLAWCSSTYWQLRHGKT